MMENSGLLVAFMLLLMIHSTLSLLTCKTHEQEALLKFKHSFTIDAQGILSSWVGDECCQWSGVTCDNVTGNVIKLNLGSQHYVEEFLVSSELSSALLELKFLTHLDLSWNNFTYSRIPEFMGSMKNLRYLNLSAACFGGLIPPQIGNLTDLIHLDLSTNNFEGPLHPFLKNLHSLESLSLGYNYGINGSIPLWVRDMRRLTSLDLSTNSFTNVEGGIWGIMGNPCKFKHLDLSWNFELQGDILEPFVNTSTCAAYDLEYLDLSGTNLNGSLPSWLGQLTNLKYLNLLGNNLNGSLPSWLGQLTNLKYLNLGSNGFQGRVPSSLANLSALKYLDFSQNRLSGPIPDVLGRLTKIEHLDISSNSIHGIVSDIGNLSRLSYLDMSLNNLNLTSNFNTRPSFQLQVFNARSCQINTVIPQWLWNQTQMVLLDLSCTGISGEFPKWLLNMSSIYSLNMANNQLTGSLPRDIPCSGCNLLWLDLHNNRLYGTIPHWLNYLQQAKVIDLSGNLLSGVVFEGENASSLLSQSNNNLAFVDLSDNMLSGEIKIKDGSLGGSLEFLSLRGNDFSGVISSGLCNFENLVILELAQNRFTGHIPSCLGSESQLFQAVIKGFFMDDYYKGIEFHKGIEFQAVIKGVLEKFGGTTVIHSILDLSSNHLVGTIPKELLNLTNLMDLNLSNNHLTGSIPENIGNLQSLESLDLSNNNLSGTIPQSLSALPWISKLNLSNNNLHGLIPTGRQLQTLPDPSIYAGNPGLYGFPLQNYSTKLNPPSSPTNDDPGTKDDDDVEDNREKMWFYLIILSGVAAGFWGVVGTLALNKSWRHSYFRFVEETSDKIYVLLKVRVNRFRN